MRDLILALTALATLAASPLAAATGDMMQPYDVTWDAPSKDSSGSMPIGNGDIGLNVWVEQDGDLLFYIGKTDAWSENARLLKLGRVRIHLWPNPFATGVPFRQALRLNHGDIEIRAGKKGSEITLTVWVDANAPVVHVEAAGARRFRIETTLDVWRTTPRELTGGELFSAYGMDGGPQPVIVSPDTVLPPASARGASSPYRAPADRIAWYHRNATSIWPLTLALQGMGDWAKGAPDPLLNRTFGGVIKGKGMVSINAATLASPEPRTRHTISCYLLTQQTATADDWLRDIDRLIARAEATSLARARAAHLRWWRDFWSRSWIRVSGAFDAETVSRGYVWQRFVSACAGRGASPVKFNGSIFTVDAREPNERFDADYRRWGGPYWFQNTRLIYWPMLAAGDFDLMPPLFRMYLDALPLAKERTRLYFGHGGAFFPETMYFWGSYANSNYGWDRAGKPISQVDNTFIRWYYSGALELSAIMLDYYAFTQDRDFAQRTLLPLANEAITFYDQHYPRDDDGKLLLKPAQALETWQNAVNPLPDIAGLRFVLNELLSLPRDLVTAPQRAQWRRLQRALPPLPMRQVDGRLILAGAREILAPAGNAENPELYAVFPYRLYGVGKPGLELARETYALRRVKGHVGWQQDDTQAAFLGFAQEARRDIAERFATHNPGNRFPAFWGPNFDWIPDQDHGCSGLTALQTMLLQWNNDVIPSEAPRSVARSRGIRLRGRRSSASADEGVPSRGELGAGSLTPRCAASEPALSLSKGEAAPNRRERILLFPAWPKEWDVEFKLRAPMNTTVEGTYRAGKLRYLKVTPASRARDIVILDPQ